CMQVRQTPFTF
nr:immunoglobulin light chain junction region [Macaca mulatta]